MATIRCLDFVIQSYQDATESTFEGIESQTVQNPPAIIQMALGSNSGKPELITLDMIRGQPACDSPSCLSDYSMPF
ncbi:hypothetical protein NQZ68_040290 [Dissostichus eleginoides]|nr:hypothetical protein NQZ68_040290 [Dissostichus eleginoides]